LNDERSAANVPSEYKLPKFDAVLRELTSTTLNIDTSMMIFGTVQASLPVKLGGLGSVVWLAPFAY